MHIRAILAFPVALLACLPFISAHPIYNVASDSLARRDGSYPSTIIERYNDSLDAQRRDEYITLLTRAKVSAARQAARKQGVKNKVATNQAVNKVRKESLQAQKASLPNAPPNKKGPPGKAPRPGKPSPSGWRADARAKGHIFAKEPKTPKPNAAKGAKKSEKALKSQQAANAKTVARKAAGRAKFQQAARKQGVKTMVDTNQATNKAKKESLQAQKAALPQNAPPNQKGRPGKAPQPGKPSPPGWRANNRAKGYILAKEPKTPKPNAAKGAKKSEKALKTQQAANAKTAARKAAGRAKFGDAAAAQKATTSLPARKGEFKVPGPGGATFTGKDARIATFNSHLNSASPVGKNAAGRNKKPADRQPKTFYNDPHEVPKHGTAKPIDSMHGTGREYPITAGKPKGYHGEQADLGSARVVTQATGRTVQSGTKTPPETAFKGVIAHDSSRTLGAGYHDHFEVPFTPPPHP